MFDTIKIQLHKRNFDYNKLIDVFENKLQINSTIQYETGYMGKSILVNYKNFKFNLSNTYLTVTGSIPKLVHGNNVINPSYQDIILGLDELENVLELCLQEALVKRIDVGCNFQMNHPVKKYLDLLATPTSCKMNHFESETKEFRRIREGSIMFYDKKKEAKSKGVDLQTINSEKLNLLRYEIKIFKPLLKKIGLIDLKFKDLYNEDVYLQLVKEWYNKYLSIPKLTDPVSSEIIYDSVLKFKYSLILNGINHLGGMEVIKSHLAKVPIHRKVRSDIRKFLKNKIGDIKSLSPVLLQELDQKMYYQFRLAGVHF